MAQPYVGEIRMFAGNFAPNGWMFCEGQLMPISENETLYQLIGTTYGGDGQSTFALPDMRGRLPLHQVQVQGPGESYVMGQTGGVEEITLTAAQIPVHGHALTATSALGTDDRAGDRMLAQQGTTSLYLQDAPTVPMNAQSVTPTGGSQPHTNLQPYLCIDFIISLFGVFPSPQ